MINAITRIDFQKDDFDKNSNKSSLKKRK